MAHKITDWKDVAGSYYDKATSLAILVLLFSFIVSPKMEVKSYHREIKVTKAIEIPPEIKEKIKPPEQQVKPQIQIMVEEDDISGDDEDIEIVETIASTSLDPYEEKEPPSQFGQTSKFVVWEDPPIAIKQVSPVYPDFAKKSGIEGTVILEVEVFETGKVGAIDVLKSLMPGPGGLDEAAIKAVKQWEFQPAKSSGKPIACWVKLPIGFTLD